MNKFIAIFSGVLAFEKLVQHLDETGNRFVKMQREPCGPCVAILFEAKSELAGAFRVLEAAMGLPCSGSLDQLAVFQIYDDFQANPVLASNARLNAFFNQDRGA